MNTQTKLSNNIRLNPGQDKQAELDRMKRLATGLLLLVTAVFIWATFYVERYVWMGFVQAAAEAAMVGAIADWFAVTALFRYPLGLKIPHTAILPNRKDSFGRIFGLFVQQNFLSEPVIAAKLRSMNVADQVARWISEPENSRAIADFAAAALRGMLQVMRDEDIQEVIEQGLVTQVRSMQVTPLLGSALSLVASGNRHKDLLNGLVKFIAPLLEENKMAIRQRISHETPWWMPKAIDDRIYHKVVDTIEETLREVTTQPDHPLHQRFEHIIQQLVQDLKSSPELIAQGEVLKEEYLQDPAVQEFSSSLWLDLKTTLLEHTADPESDFRQPIRRGVVKFGEALQEDELLLAKINLWVEDAARYLINGYGHEVGHLISQTISGWDAEAASQKIELQVGKDLQFIRINGTIVGGLAGLLIHMLSVLLA